LTTCWTCTRLFRIQLAFPILSRQILSTGIAVGPSERSEGEEWCSLLDAIEPRAYSSARNG
jgi:hypothetical protein